MRRRAGSGWCGMGQVDWILAIANIDSKEMGKLEEWHCDRCSVIGARQSAPVVAPCAPQGASFWGLGSDTTHRIEGARRRKSNLRVNGHTILTFSGRCALAGPRPNALTSASGRRGCQRGRPDQRPWSSVVTSQPARRVSHLRDVIPRFVAAQSNSDQELPA